MNINNEHEFRRAKLFFDRKIMVHVSRISGIFTNGLIVEISPEFFIIKDRFGGKEIPTWFDELKKPLEEFKEEGA